MDDFADEKCTDFDVSERDATREMRVTPDISEVSSATSAETPTIGMVVRSMEAPNVSFQYNARIIRNRQDMLRRNRGYDTTATTENE